MSKDTNKKVKKKKDPVIILLDIIIIVLIFAMIYVGANALLYREIADRKTFAQDAKSMSFDIRNGNYAGLIQGKYMNEFYGETEPAGYHALGDYVEAAFFYKVYDTKGYAEKANKQKAIMDESRVKMKELTVFADKADKMFMISE